MKFVIYAPTFDENVGGAVVLHALCARLNELGYDAVIWPYGEPPPTMEGRARQVARAARAVLRGDEPFRTGPFPRRLATNGDLRDAVVVYPEVVGGNPLGARCVARWLLHKPGYHTGVVDYGGDDIFFFYQNAFNDPALNPSPDNRLTVTWMNPVYREGNGERQGRCYILRKGAARAKLLPHDFVVDSLSPAEMAEAFRRFEYVVSYDQYTMLTIFAALCGCVPIVEPEPGVTSEQWQPEKRDRWGIAYGWEEQAWARETRPLLLEKLSQDRAVEDQMIHSFASKCRHHKASLEQSTC